MHTPTFVTLGLLVAVSLAGCHGEEAEACPIGWQPGVAAPVFYGHRDYTTADGAPGTMRVFFPSLDGSPSSAAIVGDCGTFPPILFGHGQCLDDQEPHKRWFFLPAQLARAGYVVAVPYLSGVQGGNPASQSDVALLDQTLEWLRTEWAHNGAVSDDKVGVAGHSYGGMVTAKFAVEHGADAFASIDSPWFHPPGNEGTLYAVDAPRLTIWGTGGLIPAGEIEDQAWDALATPKHKAVFEDAGHFDYLHENEKSPCRDAPGPCPHTAMATWDIVTMFLGEYVTPQYWGSQPLLVPDDLSAPTFSYSQEQQFFAGVWLQNLEAFAQHPKCEVTLTYDKGFKSGTKTYP